METSGTPRSSTRLGVKRPQPPPELDRPRKAAKKKQAAAAPEPAPAARVGGRRPASSKKPPTARKTAKKPAIPGGTVHALPANLAKALAADPEAMAAWADITPLARNEWICWVESAKLSETRESRVARALVDLAGGKRRPCCWPGCAHRVRNGK
eukprot:TRINITY_DN14434_c0_g1_i1.p4 TRINITY_DN14434_c0_g1~~TRINITY_DN14434_c0_g1_i1.p4  ORF type:complete len:154 (+),score=16.09 TRINITY_DN14434_c0_g1_i1:178-639(+)